MIPSGLSCDSVSTIPLIGCCPPTVSTIWGIGVTANAGFDTDPRDSYTLVSSQLTVIRDMVNNWPVPLDVVVSPNSIDMYTWQYVGGVWSLVPFPTHTCGGNPPPLDLRPFDNYSTPFGALKHEPSDPLIAVSYQASAIRTRVRIASEIPQIRRKTVAGRSFGYQCEAPGHRYDLNPLEEDFVVLEDVLLDNPGIIEIMAQDSIPVHPDPIEVPPVGPVGYRPNAELSRVKATFLSLP